MGGSFCNQNHLEDLVKDADIDALISPLCDDALEELLCGVGGQHVFIEQAAILKGKFRSDCRDFKIWSLPLEHVMLQMIILVQDVVNKRISFVAAKKHVASIEASFSKIKSEDDRYERCNKRGKLLKERCTHCINRHKRFINKINQMGLQASIDDIILSHYLDASVIPVLDLYRDIVNSYENLKHSYECSSDFFKVEWDFYTALNVQESYYKLHDPNERTIVSSNTKKLLIATPVILVVATIIIGGGYLAKRNYFK